MTKLQTDQISEMSAKGESYARIADALGISENTVKSYCHRNNAAKEEPAQSCCLQCGNPLERTPGVKPRKFCSGKCRVAWWAANPGSLNRKAVYRFTCPACGTEFESYGNKGRKYCSHACYIAARFKRVTS
jgi:endogenous inhibitor of DNA gyrase (YacG/DUF329 family)